MTPPGALTFVGPRRAKPPRHLADLPPAERRAVVAEMGQPTFRAAQLSTHYFSHLTDDPEQMSDLPLALRSGLTQEFFPPPLTPRPPASAAPARGATPHCPGAAVSPRSSSHRC